MAIPESQLETWSHQGAVATASSTYRSIQTALEANTSLIRNRDHEVYLQGSYKNDTNIRGDSDVDVVVQLNATFGYDLSLLHVEEQQRFQIAYPTNAKYLWEHFRQDVLQSLRAYYGARAVVEGNKSLKLLGGSGRLSADIVPSIHFRRYISFPGQPGSYIDGISFHGRQDRRAIVNFPKPHYSNAVAKNSVHQTNGWYKPAVRMFKNARTYLIDHRMLSADVAPSYFLECLLFNVPDDKFGSSFEDTFVEVFNWLWGQAPANSLVCQNRQVALFGNSPEQWDLARARLLLGAFKGLWDNW